MQPWHLALHAGAALSIATASEEEGSRCGTWCEDSGYLADGCNCGVCGSYGDCRQLQCPHPFQGEQNNLETPNPASSYNGREMAGCPESARTDAALFEAMVRSLSLPVAPGGGLILSLSPCNQRAIILARRGIPRLE